MQQAMRQGRGMWISSKQRDTDSPQMSPTAQAVAASDLELVLRARSFGERAAVLDADGTLTYAQLLSESAAGAAALLAGRNDLEEARVALLIAPSRRFVTAQWSVWRAGGVVVPLCISHPAPEIAHVLDDAQVSCVVVDDTLRPVIEPLARARNIALMSSDTLKQAERALPSVSVARAALLLYTSGSTGKPKGVLLTHAMLSAQLRSMTEAWEWTSEDRLLHTLPLHHLHGLQVGLGAALWAGATCELLPRFDAEHVWQRLQAGDGINVFMGVPTMYSRLVQSFEAAEAPHRARMREGCRRVRLFACGSAALPAGVFDTFADIAGQPLLERYGMTETGLLLGNPLRGERHAGSVGAPFPGVELRIVNDAEQPVGPGVPGQLQVRGQGVFKEYFRNPEATSQAFSEDGWFRTGDVVVVEHHRHRILGRASTDILKTGGYKVSALEIEEVLREHPFVAECAVVGVPDAEWGQRVAAAVVLRAGTALDLDALRAFCKERLAPYKAPALLNVMPSLPRNAMGKVQKPQLTASFC